MSESVALTAHAIHKGTMINDHRVYQTGPVGRSYGTQTR